MIRPLPARTCATIRLTRSRDSRPGSPQLIGELLPRFLQRKGLAAKVEASVFDPWQALREHRPLGDVQRVLALLGPVLGTPDAAAVWRGIERDLAAAARGIAANSCAGEGWRWPGRWVRQRRRSSASVNSFS